MFHTEAVSSALPSDQWIHWYPGPEIEAALPAPNARLSAALPETQTQFDIDNIQIVFYHIIKRSPPSPSKLRGVDVVY